MNPLRQQMASLLTEAARDGIKKLDKKSPAARELKAVDIDAVLRQDIDKICAAITFFEISAIMSLTMKLKSGRADNSRAKEDLREIALRLAERVEKKSGRLNIPSACRDLLINL